MKATLKRPSIALLMAVLSGVVLGCSGAQPHAEAEPLPFIVHLKTLNLPNVREDLEGESAEDKQATPALFGDPRVLTAALATSLKKARLFIDVVTDESTDQNMVRLADLELEITVAGDDFGKGTPDFSGAVFSTMMWLVGGHLAWFIDDRTYPDSDVSMSVTIRTPGAKGVEYTKVFEPKNLRSNLMERAGAADWFLNILLPPWFGDGDSKEAGTRLAARTLQYFARYGPEDIKSSLPANVFDDLSCFLFHVPGSQNEVEELLIVSKQAVDRIQFKFARRSVQLTPEVVARREVRGPDKKRDILLRLSRHEIDVGARLDDRYYALPLDDEIRGYIRVETTLLDGSTSPWTIFRPLRSGNGSEALADAGKKDR